MHASCFSWRRLKGISTEAFPSHWTSKLQVSPREQRSRWPGLACGGPGPGEGIMDTRTRACEAPRPSEDARPAFRAETHSGLHRAPRLLSILCRECRTWEGPAGWISCRRGPSSCGQVAPSSDRRALRRCTSGSCLRTSCASRPHSSSSRSSWTHRLPSSCSIILCFPCSLYPAPKFIKGSRL